MRRCCLGTATGTGAAHRPRLSTDSPCQFPRRCVCLYVCVAASPCAVCVFACVYVCVCVSLSLFLNVPALCCKHCRVFETLRFVVIDEAHMYRGAFGSHVALVVRRLLRICAHHNNTTVQFICSTATLVRGAGTAKLHHALPALTCCVYACVCVCLSVCLRVPVCVSVCVCVVTC